MTEFSAARWQRMEALYLEAMEQPESDRQAFLDQACADDAELRIEIEELVAAEEDAESRLDRAVHGTLELAADGTALPSIERVGPYRILREIGRGGMGTVYLAERDDEHYRKQVAVKVVRHGPGSRELRQRLRQERQILANLDHPYIARLLDGGNTDDGSPYFVAEYVRGEPIDQFCDRRCLSVTARLELFCEVCDAVQYAHRNLIIHRDLKPSNLLITDPGVPKLLDFGIAKLLDSKAKSMVATVTGLSLLTPEYASPEQVSGEPLTTATDVYSLGVLLYELLTGRRPYSIERGQPLELLRAICELEPDYPSVAVFRRPSVSDLPANSQPDSEVAHPAHQGRAAKLHRRLRGDLDKIVLRALRKIPEERYASVDQLADDIQRHLAGLPVQAQGDALSYRWFKFLRRHRFAMAGVATAVLTIFGVISFYTARLAKERDRALSEERQSAQVVAFLRELFENADPGRSRGEEITARELLDQGAERIPIALEGQPRVQADLMDLMGAIYTRLGLYDQAGPLLDSSMALRRHLYGPAHPDVATSLHHQGIWLRETGRYQSARRVLRQAIEVRQEFFGSGHPEVADSLTALADLLFVGGEYVEAEGLFRQALEIRRALHGAAHPDVATSLSDLGATLYRLARLEEAEPRLREAFSLRQSLFGSEHPDVATSRNALAAVLLARGDRQAAEQLYRQSLETWRRLYGSRHPQVAHTLNNLGELARRRGAYAEAELLLGEALEITRDVEGEEHPNFASRLTNLADTLRAQGELEVAERNYRQALEIALKTLPPDNRITASIWMKLGDTRLARGDLSEAIDCYRETLQARRSNPPDEPWKLSTPMVRLGRAHLAANDGVAAAEVLHEAVEILRRERPDDRRTTEAEALLAEAEARGPRE